MTEVHYDPHDPGRPVEGTTIRTQNVALGKPGNEYVGRSGIAPLFFVTAGSPEDASDKLDKLVAALARVAEEHGAEFQPGVDDAYAVEVIEATAACVRLEHERWREREAAKISRAREAARNN